MKIPSQKVIIGLIIGLFVLGALAGSGAYLAYQVYTVRDNGSFVRSVGRWLPAAKIGSHTISYGAFLDTRETLRVYLGSEAGQAAGAPSAMTTEIEKQILDRLIREKIVADAAKERSVTVTDEEVKNSFDVMAAMNSSTVPDVGKFLQDNYRWTEEEFRNNVVKPAILEERVAATFTTDTQAQWAMLEAFMNDRIAKADIKIYLKFE